MGRTILEMEGKEHLRQRRLVTPAFSPRALREGLDAVVEGIVNQLVDQFVRDGKADLVSQFTFTFPLRVMAHVMALPIGNTGGANVSAFQPMPIPEDLRAILAADGQQPPAA